MAYIFNDPNDQNHKIWGQLDFVIFRFEYKYNTTIIPIYTRKSCESNNALLLSYCSLYVETYHLRNMSSNIASCQPS